MTSGRRLIVRASPFSLFQPYKEKTAPPIRFGIVRRYPCLRGKGRQYDKPNVLPEKISYFTCISEINVVK